MGSKNNIIKSFSMLLCIANRIGPRATPQVFSGTMTAAPKERVYRVDGLMPVPVMPDPIGAGPALAGPSCPALQRRAAGGGGTLLKFSRPSCLRLRLQSASCTKELPNIWSSE